MNNLFSLLRPHRLESAMHHKLVNVLARSFDRTRLCNPGRSRKGSRIEDYDRTCTIGPVYTPNEA